MDVEESVYNAGTKTKTITSTMTVDYDEMKSKKKSFELKKTALTQLERLA